MSFEIRIKQRVPNPARNQRPQFGRNDRRFYRTEYGGVQRIPVGMPDAAWAAHLSEQEQNAAISHANWVARRIASHIESMRRGGAYYWRRGTQARQYSAQDCLDTIRLDKKFLTRIGIYQVYHALQPYTYARSVALVEAQVREVRKGNAKQPSFVGEARA